MKLEICHLC